MNGRIPCYIYIQLKLLTIKLVNYTLTTKLDVRKILYNYSHARIVDFNNFLFKPAILWFFC
jgi:hypothetical protein